MCLRSATWNSVLKLVGPASVIPEVRGGERHIHVTRLADWFPRIHRFGDGELAAALLQDAANAIEVLGALTWVQLRPDLAIGTIGGLDGAVGVGGGPLRDLGEWLLGGRVVGDGDLAARWSALLPINEEAVALANCDDLTGFGGWGVGPRAAAGQTRTCWGHGCGGGRSCHAGGTRSRASWCGALR